MLIKKDVLQGISILAESKQLTKKEVIDAFVGKSADNGNAMGRVSRIAETFYFIGASIVVLGVALLVFQNWTLLSSTVKVLVTIGVAIFTYITGVLVAQNKNLGRIGDAFQLISGLLMPVGLGVLFSNANLNPTSYECQIVSSFLLFISYIFSFSIFRKNIFILFSIFFGGWLFFSLTGFVAKEWLMLDQTEHFFEYRAFIVGFFYMCLGYKFSNNRISSLSGFLYGLGSSSFLGSSFLISGLGYNQNLVWNFIFPVIVFFVLLAGAYIRSKSFFVIGTVFLILFILKITFKYFAQELGWSSALVMAGFFIIGAGYLVIYLKKRCWGRVRI